MSSVLTLIAQRVALGIVLLFFVSLLIFLGTLALPGDVAQTILGQSATPESLANLRASLGLDQPPLTRYLNWLAGIFQGDLGNALTNGRPIAESIGKRLGNTMFLAFWTAVIAVPLSILLGLLSVRYRNRWPDKLISSVTLTSISVPEFLLAYVMIFVFGVKLGWFPTISLPNDSMSLGQKLYSISLPILVLVMVILAHMMRMTRAAILNVMESAYIETAELKGIKQFTIIASHAMPNALSPIINVVMLNLAYLVVGVVVVEVVFTYPGLGSYLVDHVAKRDLPVVQAVGIIFAAIYIGLNILADVLSILTNPRLRHPK
ncbi:MAG: ABC transporter permease [Gammaproteobacteria bacterium]|nr:ABC transporter permease [Gammaproteobacteria bacterium]